MSRRIWKVIKAEVKKIGVAKIIGKIKEKSKRGKTRKEK